jgi:hypothetical protein
MTLDKGQKHAISIGLCYPVALKTKRVIWNQRRRLLTCALSEAKRVMVMLARDCGRVHALSELLCIMGGGGVWKEGGCAWVQRDVSWVRSRCNWWLLVVLAWY